MQDGTPIFDYPVLSDDRVGSDETVYRFVGDWERGERLGEVKIKDDGPRFKAKFDFGDEGKVTLKGDIPGNGTWVGKGHAEPEDGTGKFKDKRDRVPIEGRNPKRWG